jgi:ketosteroid isomerase-like protein
MYQHNSSKQGINTINSRCMITLTTTAVAWFWIVFAASHAFAQPATGIEEVKAASKGFYEAIAVIDNGAAMDKVWAHKPYVTFVGPRSRSIIVGWDAQKNYWAKSNKLFLQRDVTLQDQQIHVNGNLAWEIGQENAALKMADGSSRTIHTMVTNVYEKIDDRWFIVSHHAQPKPE